MVTNNNHWNGRRVLVTGSDGFIGSHLAELLVREGAQVRALVQYNSFNSWGWLDTSPFRKAMEIVPGDVRDSHFCDTLLKSVDTVFHLAALIAIPYSYVAPDSYIETNIRGTANICQSARLHGIQRLVQMSTSEVYGTARYVPIDEAHPLTPQSPYSATKVGSDAISLSFYYSFGLPVCIARPFNTYGPRQSARAVIPSIITQIGAGKGEIALGELESTRDFTFVGDTCKGLLTVAAAGAVGEVYNIGSNTEISIREVFQLLAELMASSAVAVKDNLRMRPPASEVFRLMCDNRKVLACGFKPETPLREGLLRTIEWFTERNNAERYKDTYNV